MSEIEYRLQPDGVPYERQAAYWFRQPGENLLCLAIPEIDWWKLKDELPACAVGFTVYGFIGVHSYGAGEAIPLEGSDPSELCARWSSGEFYSLPLALNRLVGPDMVFTLWYRAGFDERVVMTLEDNHLELNDLEELAFVQHVARELIAIAQLWTGKPE